LLAELGTLDQKVCAGSESSSIQVDSRESNTDLARTSVVEEKNSAASTMQKLIAIFIKNKERRETMTIQQTNKPRLSLSQE